MWKFWMESCERLYVCVGVCLWFRIIAAQLQSQQGSVYANANNYESWAAEKSTTLCSNYLCLESFFMTLSTMARYLHALLKDLFWKYVCMPAIGEIVSSRPCFSMLKWKAGTLQLIVVIIVLHLSLMRHLRFGLKPMIYTSKQVLLD